MEHGTPILFNQENVRDMTKYLRDNSYKFHQFYNIDVDTSEYAFIQFMMNYKDSPRSKVLNKTYYDIETFVNEKGDFTDAQKVKEEVNSIALYNNVSNTAYVIAFVTECDITDPVEIEAGVRKLFAEKVAENETYNIPGMTLVVLILENEKEVLEKFFSLMKEQNTLALIGFNSSTFDDPYMFNRCAVLFGEERTKDMVSEFGILDKYGDSSFELPDYLLVDLLKLYKPVGQGGGGLGKSLPDFKLNTVAKKELGITKLDLPGGFRHNYLHNIIGYLTYNIFDTLITFKLDEKLLFMELMFDLSKYNNATMGATINGRSILYTYRNNLMYATQDKVVRTKKFSGEVLYEPTIKL